MRKDYLLLPSSSQTSNNAKIPSRSDVRNEEGQQGSASLIEAVKGLLDLTNDYLENIEIQKLGPEAGSLALIADEVSCAMRG